MPLAERVWQLNRIVAGVRPRLADLGYTGKRPMDPVQRLEELRAQIRRHEVEPLPFHGMHDQIYGQEKRPPFPSDALNRKYNTRWVEGRVLKQTAQR